MHTNNSLVLNGHTISEEDSRESKHVIPQCKVKFRCDNCGKLKPWWVFWTYTCKAKVVSAIIHRAAEIPKSVSIYI